jgi:hypothetical protein
VDGQTILLYLAPVFLFFASLWKSWNTRLQDGKLPLATTTGTLLVAWTLVYWANGDRLVEKEREHNASMQAQQQLRDQNKDVNARLAALLEQNRLALQGRKQAAQAVHSSLQRETTEDLKFNTRVGTVVVRSRKRPLKP